MPQIREYTVYKFKELSEDSKEKAIERFRENNLDYEWWDSSCEDFATIAEIIGIDLRQRQVKQMNGKTRLDPAIYFSGFYSQGDGACFEGTYSYAKSSVREIKKYAPQDKELHRIALELSKIQQRYFYKVTASVKHSGHYYHEHSTTIDVGAEDREMSIQDQDAIAELLRDFMHWIYRSLEKEFDYLQSDEAIIETIEANDYDFTEDGRID